jgi:O-antigen ligase
MVLDRLKKSQLGNWQLTISVSIALFLWTVAIVPDISNIFVIFLLLCGFVSIKGNISYLATLPLSTLEKVFLYVFGVYTLISLVSFFYWPATSGGQMRLEDDLKFLLLLPLYFLLRRFHLDLKVMRPIFVILCLLLGSIAILQYILLVYFNVNYTYRGIRVSGGVHPMRYAVFVLIAVGFVINTLLVQKSIETKTKIIISLSAILGVVACILTQTRGVWLAIPVLIFMYLAFLYNKGRKRMVFQSLAGVLLAMTLAYQLDFVQKRISSTIQNVELYKNGNGSSSVGARFDMYSFSLDQISQKPIWGHGLNAFEEISKEYRANGGFEKSVSEELGVRRTPHNEFIQALIERGLIGLFITILLFAIPAYIFFMAAISKSEEKTYLGLSGLSMLLVFFVAGQSGTIFNHNIFTHYYIIMVFLFVSQIRVREVKKEQYEVFSVIPK